MDKDKALQRLKTHIQLGTRGITLPEEISPVSVAQSSRGGAGPQGTACHVGLQPGEHSSQTSLVIYPKGHYLAPQALPTEWWPSEKGQIEGRTILKAGEGIFLEKVKVNWKGTLSDGRKVSTLSRARFHPYGTYSMGLFRICRHQENNQGCLFCTSSAMVKKFNFPDRSPDDDLLDHLKLGLAQNLIRSVTLTSATFDSPERTVLEMIPLTKRIREETGLSVQVHLEPVFDRPLMKDISRVADSAGIFLESFDERVRQRICPGKAATYSQDDYLRSWELAVDCFGWGKVMTVQIIGLDENYDVVLRGIERAAQIGVVTSLLWLRVGSPGLETIIPSYLGKEEEMLQLLMEAGKIMVKHSLDTISAKNSGCLGCQGCSATREAVYWAKAATQDIYPQHMSCGYDLRYGQL